MICKHTWKAPYLHPPGQPPMIRAGGMDIPVRGPVTHVPQNCCLTAGHEGPHRSLSNVITSV